METIYTIRFVRPVFEKLTVKVKASCEEEAIFNAAHTLMTKRELETQWAGQFDETHYTGFVESITAQDECDEVQNETENETETYSVEDDSKYVILQADMGSGEGNIVPQPWLSQLNPFMIADLCEDWSVQIAAFKEGELESYVKALRPEKSARIIPFPNRGKNSET